MLKSRFPVARPLAFCVWLGSIAAVGVVFSGFAGCQGPDTFLRKPAGGGGAGGNKGTGGSLFGVGGHFGTGGSTFGSGGSPGMGGSSGTGGRIGTGGSLGMGGTNGSGGAIGTGGHDAGVVVFFDGSADSEGGTVGNGPCASLCAPAISFVPAGNYHTGNLGLGQACYETTGNIQGIVCSSFTQGGNRMLSVNGVADPTCDFNNAVFPAPPKINGGYCLQVSAGVPDFAAMAIF